MLRISNFQGFEWGETLGFNKILEGFYATETATLTKLLGIIFTKKVSPLQTAYIYLILNILLAFLDPLYALYLVACRYLQFIHKS